MRGLRGTWGEQGEHEGTEQADVRVFHDQSIKNKKYPKVQFKHVLKEIRDTIQTCMMQIFTHSECVRGRGAGDNCFRVLAQRSNLHSSYPKVKVSPAH